MLNVAFSPTKFFFASSEALTDSSSVVSWLAGIVTLTCFQQMNKLNEQIKTP
jgi:hypothetical protein